MTVADSNGNDRSQYYDLPNPESSLNTEDEHEQLFEDTPLLGNGHLRPRSPSVCRSRTLSGASHRADTSSPGLSIWTLTRFQKIILATTAAVDLLSFLSVSIMAPFFPEEVRTPFIS